MIDICYISQNFFEDWRDGKKEQIINNKNNKKNDNLKTKIKIKK